MARTDRYNGLTASLAVKAPVIRALTTDRTPLSGAITVDGHAFQSGDRILLVGQTNPVENGIWEVNASSAWQRAPDFDGNRDATRGTLITALNAGGIATLWSLETTGPIQIGTSSLSFSVYLQGGLSLTTTIPTIAALIAIAVPTNGKSVEVTEDGRGGTFVFDSSLTAAADGGTTFKATDATVGSWARRYSGPLNVQWFGAVGDGVTNDAPAFQSAVNSLPLNTADVGVLSPVGFANGGEILVPRGRYRLNSTVTLQRGARLIGESRESTQLISFIAGGDVIRYLDAGRYVPDEIGVSKLSIWQDASVTPTSGAGINVNIGTSNPAAVCATINDVIVEGTHRGIVFQAGIGCSVRNSFVSKTVSHGIHVEYDGSPATTTTSTLFENTYSNQSQTGSGFKIDRGAYCGFIGCASDSNAGYGYEIDLSGGGLAILASGSERNALGGAYVKDTNSALVQLRIVNDTGVINGITLVNASGVTLLSPAFTADAGNTGVAVHITTPRRLKVIAPYFDGPYATSRYNSTDQVLQLDSGFAGGQDNAFVLGAANLTPTDALLTLTGLLTDAQNIGLNQTPTFSEPGVSRNTGQQITALTANTVKTYPLVIGQRINNVSRGAASTITRAAGQYIIEQTPGATANANLMIDATAGTIPAGNWSIYNDSVRPSMFKGPIAFTALTAASAPNNSLFVDSADNVLKFKNSGGVVNLLY